MKIVCAAAMMAAVAMNAVSAAEEAAPAPGPGESGAVPLATLPALASIFGAALVSFFALN